MDETINRRLYLIGFIILIATLLYYQVIGGSYYFNRAKNNYVRALPLRSIRGAIFDRNNNVLARDRASFNISVIPYQVRKNKEKLFEEISHTSGTDLKQINANYKKNLLNMFTPVNIVIDIDKETALKLKEEYPSDILINSMPQRVYSMPQSLAHILGYVKDAGSFYDDLKKYGYTPLERAGFMGIEEYYDIYLRGRDGGNLIEVDSRGEMVGFLGNNPPIKGKDIVISIDSRVQKIAYDTLQEERGAIIIMDSDSGEVLCLVSSPSYDANRFIKGKNIGEYFIDKNKPLINRAVQSRYPLGSTFKPIIAVAALEENKINPYTDFICSGSFLLGRAKFRCWSTHGKQNLYQALAHSCNVYFYNLGKIIGPELIAKWARRFQLDKLTKIDLPYEVKSIVPDPAWKKKNIKESWYGGDTINYSIGQGYMNATPIALLSAYNIFATDGYFTKPYLIKKIGDIDSRSQEKFRVDISDLKLKTVKDGMRQVISLPGGSAHVLESLGLNISGKTGTAQTNGKAHGWFGGFFRYNKRGYTFCVFLENCGSSAIAVKKSFNLFNKLKEEQLI